ncbi:MAG: hypothetical protein WBW33_00210, partial [Bryobacteraceae bacterium]
PYMHWSRCPYLSMVPGGQLNIGEALLQPQPDRSTPGGHRPEYPWRNIHAISSCPMVRKEQMECAVFPAFSVGVGSLRFATRFITAKERHF